MNVVRAIAVAVTLAAAMNRGYAADLAEPVLLKGHDKAVTTVAWSTDGKTVATAGDDRTIRVWNPVNGKQTMHQCPGIPARPTMVRLWRSHPDLKLTAVNHA